MKSSLLSAGFVAILLSGIGAALQPAHADDGVIRIGVTLRMLVDNGRMYGQLVRDELMGLNAAGGINGHKLQVTLLDDECSPQEGVANTNRFIEQDKVDLVIGSTCSSVSLAMVAMTSKAHVPMITPSSGSASLTKKGSAWLFRTAVSERYTGGVEGKYLGGLGARKFAYLNTSDAAAVSFADQVAAFMRSIYHVEPLFRGQQQDTDTDFRANLLRIKSLDPDVLVLGGQADGISRIVAQASEIGLPAKVYRAGNTSSSNAPVPETAGDAAVGLIFPTAFVCTDPRPQAQAFVTLTKKKFGVSCPDEDWAESYETAKIVELVLSKANLKLTAASLDDDRKAIRDALANLHDYQGVVPGQISFCAAPTPQCRDGNRSPVLAEYTKGGKDYTMKQLAVITFPADYGLDAH